MAHLVGISMGGGIAQELAVGYPDRVAGLVLMSTTRALAGAKGRPDLPPMDTRLAAAFAADDTDPDWSSRSEALDAMVEGELLFAGSVPFDAERVRRVAARAYDRTADMEAMQTNHWLLAGDAASQGRMSDITAPALVLHGTEDPLFPLAHGEALAAEIVGARLVTLPGMGHQHPPEPLWDRVIGEIVAHTDR